ncbi:MAG: ABC transporter ATP-binding protein [Proteobacteria bacterium]|nr:ABC transporter ATP-binding protein [Pseudomonadota bacterium]
MNQSARPDETLLEIKGLRIEAGVSAVLVDSIDLVLRRGEVLGLIGESGAGKSTLGLAAMVYARAGCRITGGEILLSGKDLRTLDAAGRRAMRGVRVAYVAQSAASAFNPAMTLMDQVCEGPLRHGLMGRKEAEANAVALFTALDLPSPQTFGRRYPHEASGGQLQRAMVAMAMSCRPDLLVLDEPTTALDVTTQIEVLAKLRELIRDHGTAALYVTHDLSVVAQIADRILVLRHGKMVETGTTAEILTAPSSPYTRALVAERQAAMSGQGIAGAPRAATVLAVEDVTIKYGNLTAVDRVGFLVGRGETVAVVGESGSGKSTLAYAAVGQIEPADGGFRFGDALLPPSYKSRSLDQRRRIQLIYQLPDIALNPRQTIGDILGRPVAFFEKMSRAAVRARVAELLRLVGLPEDFTVRLPGQLSGGQKQRVCIARALAARPELVICDEVTSALDPLVAEEILKLLKQLQDELGVSYLFITHDLGTVKRIAHRVVVMLKGRMVAEGTTAAIFDAPPDDYTRKLLLSVPEMRTDWLDEALERREIWRAGPAPAIA